MKYIKLQHLKDANVCNMEQAKFRRIFKLNAVTDVNKRIAVTEERCIKYAARFSWWSAGRFFVHNEKRLYEAQFSQLETRYHNKVLDLKGRIRDLNTIIKGYNSKKKGAEARHKALDALMVLEKELEAHDKKLYEAQAKLFFKFFSRQKKLRKAGPYRFY